MSAETKNQTKLATLISRSECEFIWDKLHRGYDRKPLLGDFIMQPELNSIGFLGQYFQLILFPVHDDNNRKENVDSVVNTKALRLFVKTLPYSNSELCEYVQQRGILKKELKLYATLLKELKKYSNKTWCGQCYYIRDDLLVMQHLSEIGYEPSRSKVGHFKSIEIEHLLQCLASMHVSSIAYEVNTGVNIGEAFKEMLQEITVSPTEPYFTTGLRVITEVIKQHPLYQGIEEQYYIKNKLEQNLENVYDMVNPSKIYRNVFCHRDPWAGNIFFNQRIYQTGDQSTDGPTSQPIDKSRDQPTDKSRDQLTDKSRDQLTDKSRDQLTDQLSNQHTDQPVDQTANLLPALLMDFQTCRYCPATIDVIFALYMNLSITERREKETEYLSWYYKCFAAELNALNIRAEAEMSWLQFTTSYQQFKLFGSLYKAIATTLLNVPNGYLSSIKLQAPEKYYRYMYVDRTSDVLMLMKGSDDFRMQLNECVADMMAVLRSAQC